MRSNAALGHDIERSIEERKIKRENFTDYDEFKKAHSQNSTIILCEIFSRHNINQTFIEKVSNIVMLHEFGGTKEANILKDADSISFFDVNLPFYFQRNSERETAFRMKWGYKRLSKVAKSIVRNFSYDDVVGAGECEDGETAKSNVLFVHCVTVFRLVGGGLYKPADCFVRERLEQTC